MSFTAFTSKRQQKQERKANGTEMVVGEHGGKTYVYERMEAKDTDKYES